MDSRITFPEFVEGLARCCSQVIALDAENCCARAVQSRSIDAETLLLPLCSRHWMVSGRSAWAVLSITAEHLMISTVLLNMLKLMRQK